MKIKFVTIGKPKLDYAKLGFSEYLTRLGRLHDVNHVVISDKHAYDADFILQTVQATTLCVLDIGGDGFSSESLAMFLKKRELDAREISFVIGGPEGLPEKVREIARFSWSLGPLTLPHDLAMVVALEALYRASTINAGLPYHK